LRLTLKEVRDMKKLRCLIFALGLAMPMLAGAAVDRYADADRSVVRSASQNQSYSWFCFGGYCFWVPC
jgi:hypothetical protein